MLLCLLNVEVKKMTGTRWTNDEVETAIGLVSEYIFPIAFKKYSEWAETNNYPHRTEKAVRQQLHNRGISLIDPITLGRKNSIARNLRLDDRSVRYLLAKAGIQPMSGTAGRGYNVDKFYKWLASSGEWINCLDRFAKRGTRDDVDDWAMLLNLDLEVVREEWKKAKARLTKVRHPLTSEWMSPHKFARQAKIPHTTMFLALRRGRHSVGKINFEIRKTNPSAIQNDEVYR